jgi:hypothetical protein
VWSKKILLTCEGDIWEVRKLASEIRVVRGTRMTARSGVARGDGVTTRPVLTTHEHKNICRAKCFLPLQHTDIIASKIRRECNKILVHVS